MSKNPFKKKIKAWQAIPVAVIIAIAASPGIDYVRALFTNSSQLVVEGETAGLEEVVAEGRVAEPMWPGEQMDVILTFTNPNPRAVQITDVSNASFGHCSDPNPSQSGGIECKLFEELHYYPTAMNVLVGETIPANGSVELTVPNALGLGEQAGEGQMWRTFVVMYFVDFESVPLPSE